MNKFEDERNLNYRRRARSHGLDKPDVDSIWEKEIWESRIDRLDSLRDEIKVERAKNPLLENLEIEYDRLSSKSTRPIENSLSNKIKDFAEKNSARKIMSLEYDVDFRGHIEHYRHRINNYTDIDGKPTEIYSHIIWKNCSCPQNNGSITLFYPKNHRALKRIISSLRTNANRKELFYINSEGTDIEILLYKPLELKYKGWVMAGEGVYFVEAEVVKKLIG